MKNATFAIWMIVLLINPVNNLTSRTQDPTGSNWDKKTTLQRYAFSKDAPDTKRILQNPADQKAY